MFYVRNGGIRRLHLEAYRNFSDPNYTEQRPTGGAFRP